MKLYDLIEYLSDYDNDIEVYVELPGGKLKVVRDYEVDEEAGRVTLLFRKSND